jgi:viologen exporter family transport system ATP-binding protein
MAAIVVDNLSKTFRTRPPPGRGLARLRRLLRPQPAVAVPAVAGLSFSIAPGERVAFIGPNGAGKSTTLKMLTGILYPTAGHAEVAGFVPWRQRRQLARRIGIVFGQRSQLWYHLPVASSFELLGRIYGLGRRLQRERLARLAATFAIGDLLERPVAQLSLGQRLRCEIAAALLHAPAILMLDEPTIGLDLSAKAALRDHLTQMSRADGTTILLTSHDTGDIERICDRAVIIDRGRLLLDLALERLRRDFLKHRTVIIVTEQERPALSMAGVAVTTMEPHRLTLAVDTAIASVEQTVAAALAQLTVRDLIIENPPLDDIIRTIYRGAAETGHADPPV